MYKLSNYNILIPYSSNEYLIYNTLFSSLAKLEQDQYSQLESFRESGATLDEEFLHQLIQCKFVLPKNYDELLHLQRRMMEERFSDDLLYLTITPTLDCNFACDYCFETRQLDSKMSQETIDQVVTFVQERLPGKKKLHLIWMGGEPLLALDIIEELSDRLIPLAAKHDLPFAPALVTNGYLLTRDVVKRLLRLHIYQIQVTLDGVGETHDCKRPLEDGSPTFDTIIQNIFDVIDLLPGLTIRVNLDKKNISEAGKLLDLFDQPGIKEKIHFSFALTDATSDQIESRCLTGKEFSKKTLQLEELRVKRGFSGSKYPKARANICGAHLKNNYVIDPQGRLFKCWSNLSNPEKSTGNIFTKNRSLQEYHSESTILLFNPVENSNCKKCQMLPLCLGGCFWRREHSLGTCTYFANELEESLRLIVQNKLYS